MSIRQMRRRTFIAALGGAAAWPLAARAQQTERVRRIGVLMPRPRAIRKGRPSRRSCRACSNWAGPTAATSESIFAGVQAMPTTFANTPRNWSRSRRTYLGRWQRDRGGVATGDPHCADRVRSIADPVGAGFVESLARPGGNATGFTLFEYSLSGKWLELLKEIAPGVTRAAVLRDPP